MKLEDGSVIKIRPAVTGVVRVDGQYDPEGNPIYVVKTMVVSAMEEIPENLRRPTT